MTTTGLINPGAMGASVGAAANHGNNKVIWASEGRSEVTRKRAHRGKLKDCRTLDALIARSDFILSVCPPHSAEDVANLVADSNFRGIFVEANAINPDKTRRIEKAITSASGTFVDGGIIGGPAWEAGSGTRLYLSGKSAPIPQKPGDSRVKCGRLPQRLKAPSCQTVFTKRRRKCSRVLPTLRTAARRT